MRYVFLFFAAVCVALLARNAGIAAAAGPLDPIDPADLSGEWSNAGGGKLTISVEGGSVTVTGRENWTGTYDAASGVIKIERDATPDDIRAKPGQPAPPDWARQELAKLIGKIRAELKVSVEGGAYYTLDLKGKKLIQNAAFKEEGNVHKVWKEDGETAVQLSYRRVVRTI